MAVAAPARSRSLTCCCKGISETSLAPGEVGGRLERGPEGRADQRRRQRAGVPGGRVGSGEGGWPCGCEGAGTVPSQGAGEQKEVGAPSPLQRPLPPLLLPSHRRVLRARVRNVTGGSRGEGQTRAAGRERGCTRPPSPRGGEGDRAGKEGVRGEAGQGQARGPARKARALGPRGRRRRHHCQDAPRPERPLASPSPQDTPRPSLHPPASSTASPNISPSGVPSPFCCPELQNPKCDKRSPAEPLRSQHAVGTPGSQPASEAGDQPNCPPVSTPQSPPLPSSLLPPPPPSPSGA